MQESRDSGLEGLRTRGKRKDTGKEGSGLEVCRTGEMVDRRDIGKVGYATGGMQDRWDAVLQYTVR